MKRIFNLLFIACLITYPAQAQTPIAGFVFVNATGLSLPVKLHASDKPLYIGDGLPTGIATSGLGLPVGSYTLKATSEGCKPAETLLNISAGKCPTILCFLSETKDNETGKVQQSLQFMELPHSPPAESAYVVRFLYLPKQSGHQTQVPPLTGKVGDQSVTLKPFEPLKIEARKTVSFAPTEGGDLETTDLEEPGAYYYLIFRNADGKLASTISQDKLYVW
jgi:hypothetical protein